MGATRASIQDLRSLVGIISSEQDASVELRISFRTSSDVAGVKLDSGEGMEEILLE